jgi:hypothetical protein
LVSDGDVDAVRLAEAGGVMLNTGCRERHSRSIIAVAFRSASAASIGGKDGVAHPPNVGKVYTRQFWQVGALGTDMSTRPPPLPVIGLEQRRNCTSLSEVVPLVPITAPPLAAEPQVSAKLDNVARPVTPVADAPGVAVKTARPKAATPFPTLPTVSVTLDRHAVMVKLYTSADDVPSLATTPTADDPLPLLATLSVTPLCHK